MSIIVPQSNPVPKRIAFLTASVRTPRVGPSISTFIQTTVTPNLPPHITLHDLDLLSISLPLTAVEPVIPSQVTVPLSDTPYATPETNAWSVMVRQYDAIVFVTPQYNWGYPAALKNAIDHLFHEWAGKPALIVSYGGHGGGKAAGQLKQVLEGVHMKVTGRMVALGFEGREGTVAAVQKGAVSTSALAVWEGDEKREEILEAWKELLELLST